MKAMDCKRNTRDRHEFRYADAAGLVATLMEESIDKLDPSALRRLTEDAERNSKPS